MWLEINTAGSDFENVPGVIFHNCVVTISATQTTLNVGLICFDARRGSLCKPQRDQQGRYHHPQECSLHGNPPKILALRRSEISLGICFCFRFLRRALGAFGLRPENCGASRGNTTTLFAKNLECLFQTFTLQREKRGEPNIDQTLPVWGGRPRPPPCECTAQTLAQDPVELIFVADGVQPFVRYRPALEVSGKFLRTPGTAVKQHHSGRNCRNCPRRCYRIFAA